MRQLGGSAGIAYLTTILTQRLKFHGAVLTEHVSIYNTETLSRLNQLTHLFMAKGYASVAANQAYASIGGIIQGQAGIMAYEDPFFFVAIVMLIPLPLVLLFEKKASTGKTKTPGKETGA